MIKFIVNTAITYFMIATFVFMNLLFNPRLKIESVNNETKERKEVPSFVIISISLYWIFSLPILLSRGVNRD